jgi:hypothetical protein
MAKKTTEPKVKSTYASLQQAKWANASGAEFADKWNKQTKAAGKFKGLPDKVTPKGGK